MATTFEARVNAITNLAIDGSSTSPTRVELTQFLTDGTREVINVFPPSLQEYCTGATEIDDSPTTFPLSTETNVGKILYITRSDGTRQQPCRKIPAAFSDLADDSSNLKYFGSASDPVYWITGTHTADSSTTATILETFPTPTSSQVAVIYHVAYPATSYGWTGIDNFPDGAEHLVELYAAMKSLLSAMAGVTIPPNVGGSSESLTSSMSAIDGGQIGTDAEFLNFRYWFTALGEMIEDDEDIELASAQIEKINAYVNTWNIQLQGSLAEMQQYMQLFQILKNDYTMGIQMLVSGGLPQAQPQQARR